MWNATGSLPGRRPRRLVAGNGRHCRLRHLLGRHAAQSPWTHRARPGTRAWVAGVRKRRWDGGGISSFVGRRQPHSGVRRQQRDEQRVLSQRRLLWGIYFFIFLMVKWLPINQSINPQPVGNLIKELEIRSVERGICPIATSTINERTVPIIMAGCMAHEREAIFPLPV